jgi:uncharacterized protein (DUF2249 family)
MNSDIVTVDVRDDLRNGHDPFSKIMAAVARLGADEKLLLIAPFEPVPLFTVLARQGFTHESRQLFSGDWTVLFTRAGENNSSFAGTQRVVTPPSKSEIKNHKTEILEVDARGLEPPQPMVKILEALATLPDGAELRARTDRRPMHLYAQLEERGFTGETEQQTDGSYLTKIRRR